MNSYPKILVGEKIINKHLEKAESNFERIYTCENIEEIRFAVSNLIFLHWYPTEITIYLKKPTKKQFDCLLRIMEESSLPLVLCVQREPVPKTIVSRSRVFIKEEEITFKDPRLNLKASKSILRKVQCLFDMEASEGGDHV